MKLRCVILLAAAGLPLAGCHTYQGGTYDENANAPVVDQSQAGPKASPTFRPGMNREDPRDPQYITRPEPVQTTPPQP